MSAPLAGYRIIELVGIGPGPYAGQLLADMGAEVICIERPGAMVIPGSGGPSVNRRGKTSMIIDLRKPGAADIVLTLVKSADVLIEGNRPGVAERLGLGPADCHAVNPKLVYGRMTGWGQTGPWAQRAGHDINYISLTGALHAMGTPDQPPPPPINLVGDYGGGSLFLTNGVLAALLRAQKTGQGDVIDAAIVDGVNSMMSIVHGMDGAGLWSIDRGKNMLTGSAPFYRCYETSDGGYMAVGCIEPKFFMEMITLMGIAPDQIGSHFDMPRWPQQVEMLDTAFRMKTRDEWAEIFYDSDACVTPVLNYKEAITHPHNAARDGLVTINERIHPSAAPRFEMAADGLSTEIPETGQDTRTVLSDVGFSEADIEQFIVDGIVQ